MVDVQFKISEHSSANTIAIEFGPRLKCNLIINSKTKTKTPIVNIVNTVYQITDKKKEIIEQESKGMISVPVGIYTKLEIETAKIIFHSQEIPVDFTSPLHVEKAYQNLMDNLIENAPEYTSGDPENSLESFLVLLSIPFVQDEDEYSDLIQLHLSILKNLGFSHITLLNQIASSFYSQKDNISQDDLINHPLGILLNIGKTTQIGVMDNKILRNGFLDINLGTTTVLNHSLAILRDLNITGVSNNTVVNWLVSEGRVDGKVPITMKTVRRKEFNITAILNTPKIIFDYKSVTGMENEYNTILEGIQKVLKLTESITKKNLDQLLKTIVITGPGAFFKGIDNRMTIEMQKLYPEYEIKVILGEDPLNSVSNGLIKYVNLFPILKVFNLQENEQDIVIESTQQDLLKKSIETLKEIKNYIHNLDELQTQTTNLQIAIEKLPIPIKSMLNINIQQESKYWSIEFNHFLNPLIKQAQIGLKETEEVAKQFRNIGLSIAKLPKFIKSHISKVFTSYVYGLQMIRSVHLDSVNQEYLDILHHETVKFENQPEFSIEDLVQASNLSKSVINDVLDDYINKYPNIGYIDGNFIKFTNEKLGIASKILEKLHEQYYENSNDKSKLNIILNKAIIFCNFLIKGYSFLNNKELAHIFEKEKEELEKTKLSKSDLFL